MWPFSSSSLSESSISAFVSTLSSSREQWGTRAAGRAVGRGGRGQGRGRRRGRRRGRGRGRGSNPIFLWGARVFSFWIWPASWPGAWPRQRLGLSLCGGQLDEFCGGSRSPTAGQVCVCAHFGEAQLTVNSLELAEAQSAQIPFFSPFSVWRCMSFTASRSACVG